MHPGKNEIIGWIGAAVLVLVAAAVYIWLSSPEVDLLPETYNVM